MYLGTILVANESYFYLFILFIKIKVILSILAIQKCTTFMINDELNYKNKILQN